MPDPLGTGVLHFNRREYFEAHEAFEDLWRSSRDELRLLYQGVVQACAGLVKHQRGQDASALTLLRKGLDKLETAPESCRSGLDIACLASDLRRVLDDLDAGRPVRWPAMRRSGDI